MRKSESHFTCFQIKNTSDKQVIFIIGRMSHARPAEGDFMDVLSTPITAWEGILSSPLSYPSGRIIF